MDAKHPTAKVWLRLGGRSSRIILLAPDLIRALLLALRLPCQPRVWVGA